MAPSLITHYEVYSAGADTTTLTTPAFTPSNGEVLVVKLATWDTANGMAAPTGGSQTYQPTPGAVAPGGFNGWVGIWVTTVSGSPGSMTVSSAPATGTASRHTMVVERWSSAQLAATPASSNGTGNQTLPSLSLTTTGANSVISWAISDAQSSNPATRAYLLSGVEDGLFDGHVAADGVFYFAYSGSSAVTSSGSYTYGMTAPSQIWVMAGVEIQAAAGGASSPTPSPLVVTSTRPAPPTRPLIVRSSLIDLAAPRPVVVSAAAAKTAGNQGLFVRNTLADPPVLTTTPPVVVGTSGRPAPVNPAITSRSSLADVVLVTTATPAPIVVSAAAMPVPGSLPVIGRGTLTDPPVLTTPPPLVVTSPTAPVLPNPPVMSRSSLADVAIVTAVTQPPLVVSAPTPTARTGPAVILRGTLVDPPVLTTPAPLVVTPPTRPPIVTPALIARGALVDLPTPRPLVVTGPWVAPRVGPVVLSRSSLADPVVVTGVATPAPLVVSMTYRPPWTYRPIVLAGSSAVCDCVTHRPSSGATIRPNSGTTTRPSVGTTVRPCAC